MMEQNFSSLDESRFVVLEMNASEIKDGVWLSNREVKDGFSEKVTVEQRKTWVKVGSKFCGDLGRALKK